MPQTTGEYSIGTTAVALGIANHLFLKRYEPLRTTVIHTAFGLILQPSLLVFALKWFSESESNSSLSLSNFLLSYFAFFTSLATSIILYRISPFHPLATVPGPLIFKITKLWRMYICWKGLQHHTLKALHDQYGPIVRTGPNEISVTGVEDVKSILGSDGLPKGPGYLTGKLVGQPYSLIQAKGEDRINRRRVWSRGFTTEAMKEYQEIVVKKAAQLGEALSARSGSEVDLLEWLNFFSFDFMAEMMFGGGSQMLTDGRDTRGVIKVLQNGVWSNEIFSHVPWFTHLARYLPAVAHNGKLMHDFAIEWCTRRITNGAEKKDLWYHLTDEAGNEKVKPSMAVVASDAVLAIVAGSDTTSTAMANLFWCLLSRPETYKRLREEVDKEYPVGTDPLLDTSRYGNMKYLTACLNEALRLLPPAPSNGNPRVVPKGGGGRVVSGYFVPEGTQVQVPSYSVHRNPDNFSPSPEAFLPERWLDGANDTLPAGPRALKTDAFITFSYGPMNCIGKNLARFEMTMVITTLMQRFDFEFAKAFKWKEWPNSKIDAFISLSKPLKVVVKSRF
ncbi:hypothetical protein V5O48_016893 [Marasmius crinis-equi]|uniref:Cytochrome P450 n=1 Tax=Marasmius crinis-equi TaxID=585013 RepID=A0ABR3EQG6_9AGAR